jgi:hypothetical protein
MKTTVILQAQKYGTAYQLITCAKFEHHVGEMSIERIN